MMRLVRTTWSDPFAELCRPIYRTCEAVPDILPPIRIHQTDVYGTLSVDLFPEEESCKIQYVNGSALCDLSRASARIEIAMEERTGLSAYYMAERLVLPIVRYLRGCLLLHASALSIDDRGVVLLADSGIGKSTLVGALLAHARGAKLICDDVLTVFQSDARSDAFYALPSQSHIAMRHDMWQGASFVDSQTAFFQKSVLKLKPSFLAREKTPIEAIVMLDKSESSRGIRPLKSNDCIADLLNVRFAVSEEWPQMASYQFKLAMKCFSNIPVYRCTIYRNDFAEASIRLLSAL